MRHGGASRRRVSRSSRLRSIRSKPGGAPSMAIAASPPDGPARNRRAAMPDAPRTETDDLKALNRLLIRALKALGDAGESETACRLAAEAWAALRKERPGEAERLNGALHYLTRPTSRQRKETHMTDPQQLDVRNLPPPQRHTLIFAACGKLSVGEAVILVNDHDPKPL